ncbi:MAG: hypothetical protein RL757_356 [Bacteroidota bacterium]|jgi:hypothetical protein
MLSFFSYKYFKKREQKIILQIIDSQKYDFSSQPDVFLYHFLKYFKDKIFTL